MPRSTSTKRRARRSNSVKNFEEAQSLLAKARGKQFAIAADSQSRSEDDKASAVKGFVQFLVEHCLAPISLRKDPVKFVAQVARNFELMKEAARDHASVLRPGDSKFRKDSTKGLRQRRHILEQFCHVVFTHPQGFDLVQGIVADGATLTQIEELLYIPLDGLCAEDRNTIRYGLDTETGSWYSLTQEQQKLSTGTEFNLPVGGDGERTRRVVVTEATSGAAFLAFRDQQIMIKDLGSSGSKYVVKQRKQLLPSVYKIPDGS